MKSQLKIGITGGSGLVAKSLRALLATSDSSPVIFVSRQTPEGALFPNECCLVGNFADPKLANEFTSRIDVLVHTATAVGPRSLFEEEMIEVDLVGTINLAKIFFKHNPKGHFIYLSTAGGLYDLEDPSIKTESSLVDPKSLYGAIKLIIEDSLESLSGEQGMVTILRAAPIYGDSLKKNQTVGLIDKLLKSTLGDSKSAVPIFDKLNSARDYLHVDDLAQAILMLISRSSESRFDVFNVGTGKETSILDVINLVNSICEGKVHYEVLPVDKNVSSLIVNADKIHSQVGWKPRISMREGIVQMYQDLIKIIATKEIQ